MASLSDDQARDFIALNQVGDEVTGTIISVEAHPRSDWGYPDRGEGFENVFQLLLDVHAEGRPTGLLRSVWTWPTVLQNEVRRARPQASDVVQIIVTGQSTSKQYSKPYLTFRVSVLNREPVEFSWDEERPLAVETAHEPERRELPPAAFGAVGTPDHDEEQIPF